MENHDLGFILNPGSVAVIGASTRPGTWGNRISGGLINAGYPGPLYFVNPSTKELLGRPSYPSLDHVPGAVELAIITISADLLWQALEACARKGVKGVVIISSGLGESHPQGKRAEEEMAAFARERGMRLIGPNVSGLYNLYTRFYATGGNAMQLKASRMSFISQGGFATHNVIGRAYSRGVGIGKFVQTGNEADLQCTDFLEFFGRDPETDAILMYIEGIKDPRRFLSLARRIAPQKPIVVYKGGKSGAGNRAAASHTGALAGEAQIYDGFFEQARCLQSLRFETIVDLGKALITFPPLKGSRIGIVTEGGSWGVMLTDYLAMEGFQVPGFSRELQAALRASGMPVRASTKNPVDTGAGRGTLTVENRISILEHLLSSDEIDGVVLHGYGTIGLDPQRTPEWITAHQGEEEEVLRRAIALMNQYQKPLLFGSHASQFESQTIRSLVRDDALFFSRLEDIVETLSMMRRYSTYRAHTS